MDKDTGPRVKGRTALGRGLDALLPVGDQDGLRLIHTDRIEPNPNQPRQHFEQKALEDLAESVREHGIMQPLVVTSIGDDRFRIVVGERRWQAAKLAGVDRVPAVIKDTTARQTLELALVENVQRADLNPLEEASAFQRLIQDFGLTQQEVARQVGKSRAAVANTLRLLALPRQLKQAVIDGRITEGHARALLALSSEQQQIAGLEKVLSSDLSVRQTEELVRRVLEPPGRQPRRTQKDSDSQTVEDDFRRALGAPVQVRRGKRGGHIVIRYSSDEELQNLYDRIVGPV